MTATTVQGALDELASDKVAAYTATMIADIEWTGPIMEYVDGQGTSIGGDSGSFGITLNADGSFTCDTVDASSVLAPLCNDSDIDRWGLLGNNTIEFSQTGIGTIRMIVQILDYSSDQLRLLLQWTDMGNFQIFYGSS